MLQDYRLSRVIGQAFRCLSTSTIARVFVLVTALSYLSFSDSATHDEPSHLTAGIYDLSYGDRRCYYVNPPLARMIAAIPASIQFDANRLLPYVDSSPLLLWGVGGDAVWAEDAMRAERWLSLGRLLLIPFAVVGLIATELLAEALGKGTSRAIAGWLYVTSPLLLSAGHSIAADGVCSSLVCLLCFLIVRWAQTPTWRYTILAGGVLGIALLTKTLVLVLTPVLMVAAGFARWGIVRRDFYQKKCTAIDYAPERTSSRNLAASTLRSPDLSGITIANWCMQGVVFVCLGLNILQIGYLGQGLMIPLGDYSFVSKTLSGENNLRSTLDLEGDTREGNRFRGTSIAWVPIPLPAMYVYGIDRQKFDMERTIPTFIAGTWRVGHWSDPLHMLLIKMPISHTLMILIGALLIMWRGIQGRCPPPEALVAFLPAVAVVGLSMTQTGMTIFARYLTPALPLVFSLAAATTSNFASERCSSEAALISSPPSVKELRRRSSHFATFGSILFRGDNAFKGEHRFSLIVFVSLITAGICEVCMAFPHVIAYQNLVFSSPRTGSTYFLGVDEYGQNLWRIQQWVNSHREGTPCYVSKIYYDRLVQLGYSQTRELPGTKTLQELVSNESRIKSNGGSPELDFPEGWVVSTGPDRLGEPEGDSPTWLRSKSVETWIAPGLAVHWLEKNEYVELLATRHDGAIGRSAVIERTTNDWQAVE